PQFAARVVNEHIKNFQEQNIRSRYNETTRATTWLRDEMEELKIKVQESEDKRIAYERKNQIWTLDDKQNITSQRLADVNKELTDAQSERMRKESLYEFAKAGNLDAVPQVQNNTALMDVLKRRTDVSRDYNEALSQYGPNFPKVQRLQAQLKDVDDSVEKEKRRILSGWESDFREARQRETMLTQALDVQKGEANQMAEKL